tara:strand:+ start:172 stop:282 length:111 start_codon:yes stop_codon:yes gene_type:complete
LPQVAVLVVVVVAHQALQVLLEQQTKVTLVVTELPM